jgi:alpha-aminoadipate/glutamate carrier protein LysW
MGMVICPVCDTEIDVDEDELEEEDTLSCSECGADLRVVSVDPLDLEPEEDDEDEEASDLDDEDEEDETWK